MIFFSKKYSNWFTSFSKDTGNRVNYQAVGSGPGARQFKAKTVDFGASDGTVSDTTQPHEGIVHIPMTGRAIGTPYKQPGTQLTTTHHTLPAVLHGTHDQMQTSSS